MAAETDTAAEFVPALAELVDDLCLVADSAARHR